MAKLMAEKKNWLLLVGALVLASLAFWLTHSYLKGQELRLAERMRITPEETRRIIVASREVSQGEVVGPETMSIREVPSSNVSPSVITPQNYSDVEGHMIKYPMSPGEPLLIHYVDRPVVSRFSQLLHEGERAVSFDIDSLSSISGMLMPGDYIDILVEYEEPKPNSLETELKIKPLIQRVRVLSVDELPLMARDQVNINYGSHSLNYGSITVAANYKDAVALTVAKHSHGIRFLLRNEKDERIVSSAAIGGYELVSDSKRNSGRNVYQYFSDNTGTEGGLEVQYGNAEAGVKGGGVQTLLRRQLKPIETDGS